MLQQKSIERIFRVGSRISLILVLWLGSVFGFQVLNKLHVLPNMLTQSAQADGPVNIWWPTDGAKVNDTQTFKVQLNDKDVSEYSMTWAVDDGQGNSMYDSSTDYPHKEAVVDLKAWNWKGNGPYKITFTATGKDGQNLGQKSITVTTTGQAQGPTTVEAGSTNPVVPTTTTSTSTNSNGDLVVTPSVSPAPSSSIPLIAGVIGAITGKSPYPSPSSATLNVAWPQSNATLKNVETFKATVAGKSINEYEVFWKVDNGQFNQFNTSGAEKTIPVDVSNWNWKSDGAYPMTFVAKDMSGNELARTAMTIYVGKSAPTSPSSSPSPSTSPTTYPSPSPIKEVTTTITNVANILSGASLYVDKYSSAARAVKDLQSSRPQDSYQINKIASNSTAMWLGSWSNISNDVGGAVASAKSQGSVPVFVAYNIPARDCGQYSAGGLNSPDAYRSWIGSIANAIGSNKAVVVLEPDALALTSCLNATQLSERYQMLTDAVKTLKAKGNIAVYLDAGHPNWISTEDMASRLTKAGVGQANGFSLNVSNFYSTNDNINYGSAISSKIGGKHFVIDTSRNGVGPTGDSQWCNPSGRSLGNRPTTSTGNSLVDAYLWIKTPGESDGNCNGGPSAGSWWLDYALGLARGAAF